MLHKYFQSLIENSDFLWIKDVIATHVECGFIMIILY